MSKEGFHSCLSLNTITSYKSRLRLSVYTQLWNKFLSKLQKRTPSTQMFLKLCNNIFMHNEKCVGSNKSTSLIFRKQSLEPETDVFCWSSIETLLHYMAMVVFTLGLFIHNFNYLFMNSREIIFHSDPQLVTHSATKYLNEILRFTKSCREGQKDLSILCESTEHTYRLNQAWCPKAQLKVKLTQRYKSSHFSCFSKPTF